MGSAKCRHCRTPLGRFHAWRVKACGRAGGWFFCRSELAREPCSPAAMVFPVTPSPLPSPLPEGRGGLSVPRGDLVSAEYSVQAG
ncbi:hypothetical protein PCLA_03f0565 [Pseudomonas citronellolis]|nr:hypothetical protein PCLA_03f0565 [Pseudomonas citronellolis]